LAQDNCSAKVIKTLNYWRVQLEKRKKNLELWLLICLVAILTACEGGPENPAAENPAAENPALPPTTTPGAGQAQALEIAAIPVELSPVEEEPTFISVSQFPVAVIEAAGAQRPAYVSVEMAGFDISELIWRVGRYEENCNRLLSTGIILPEASESWPDGVHQASFSWPAAGYFLGDTERADFVFLEAGETNKIIRGRFRQAGTGETVDANLIVDPAANRITGLQSTNQQILTAAAGDGFQLFHICLEADDTLRFEPGVELLFLENGQLNLERQPLASGDYFLQLTASNPTNSTSSIVEFPVNNDTLVPDYQVYLNAEYGFQFLYPTGWTAPQLQDGRLVTGDSSGAVTQTVTIHPDMAGRAAADLKNLALSQFGNVTVLFEDQISIGDTGALWTAYGYTAADGPHTGVLLTFTRDGIGYTVDIDSLQSAENQTIALMNILVENWLFRPDITSPRAKEWVPAFINDLAMPVMATYYQEELSNGWQRFTVGDGMSFLAVQTTPVSRDDLSDVVEHWQDVAARGVADFAISDDYSLSLNGREWSRTDFAYVGVGGMQIQGFLMAAEINDRVVAFWAEMPVTRYDEQSALFLLSLAGLR
jgi:hypothetical protein